MTELEKRLSAPDRVCSESGAVAVVVSIFLAFTVLAMAAVTIDLGSGLSTQRDLVTDTDAAALAAAQMLEPMSRSACEDQATLASSGSGTIYAEVENMLALNSPEDEVLEVRIACGQTAGKVLVGAEQPSLSVFGQSQGVTDPSAVGVSIAEYTRPAFPPLAVCKSQLLDDDGDPIEPGLQVISYKGAGADSDCLDLLGVETSSDNYAPGNWGWLDSDTGLFDGSELDLTLCNEFKDRDWCDADTGTSDANTWFPLLENSEVFRFTLFELVRNPNKTDKPASGSNSQLNPVGYAEAILLACSNANPPDPSDSKCNGNRNYLLLDVKGVTLFGDESPQLERAPLSLCGERTTDACQRQSW